MEIMSTKRAAEFLGVPEGTLRAWRHYGRVGPLDPPPSIRMGRRVVYERSRLESWLDAAFEKENQGQS